MKVPVVRKVFFSTHTFLERRLPVPGKITAAVGDEVRPFDFVGEAEIGLKREVYFLARILGIKKEELPQYLLEKEGQCFLRDEILASSSSFLGLRKRSFRAPFPGMIKKVDSKTGRVVLETLPERIKLTAGAQGKILKIIPKKAVLVGCSATTVRGVWAQGKSVEGELVVVGSFNTPLGLDGLSPELSGKIIIAGSFVSREVVAKAQAIGVKGIVVGGINYPKEVTFLEGKTFALLVTEGFGELPLEPTCWDYLKSVEARHTLLIPERKELLVPETKPHDGSEEEDDREMVKLGVGDRVEIFSWPYFARVGSVLDISERPVKFPSGIEALAVKVKLSDTEEVVEVPLRNIGVVK